MVGLGDFFFVGEDACSAVSLAGEEVNDVGGGEDGAPSCGTDGELDVNTCILYGRRGFTVVMTMMVGLKTSSRIVKRLSPR